ncbi:unnamed protein product [Urochloa decumbens]|uniref:X8 domain-containing protein n=1 Tax=Urochloa decumbens TaxID=240449 RepID=A0ABC9AD28_9POAL
MGHKAPLPRLGFIFVLVALCGGTEQSRAEAAHRATPHRMLTTVSVSKPSYPTVTTPMSAYADQGSLPGSPSLPSLAAGNGGGDAGAGGGGADAGGGGGGGGAGAGAGGGGGAGAGGGGAGAGAGGGGAGAGAGGGGGGGGSWCVASQSASPTALQVALDYACGYGADCSPIQQGGSCFNPDTVHDHASYAFNSYYQKNPAPTSCDFGGTATLTNTDPSSGSCQYPSSSSGGGQTMTPPPSPTTMPPAVPTTPMTPTPTTPDTGTPVYGMSPPDYSGSMSPPGYGSTSPPDYNDVGAAAATGRGSAAVALLCVLIATISLHASK